MEDTDLNFCENLLSWATNIPKKCRKLEKKQDRQKTVKNLVKVGMITCLLLPEMNLQRGSYNIEIRLLQKSYYRLIGIAMKNKEYLTPVAKKL